MDIGFALFQIFGNQDFLGLNIIAILAFRILYWLSFRITVLSELKKPSEESSEENELQALNKRGKRGYIIKEILIIGLGTIHIYFAISFGIYTSLIIGFLYLDYIKLNKNNKKSTKNLVIMGFSIFFFILFGLIVPIGLLVYGFMLFDEYKIEIISGLLGIVAFIIKKGFNFTKRIKDKQFGNYAIFDLMKNSIPIKVAILLLICLIPVLPIVALNAVTMQEEMIPMRDGTLLATRIYKPAFSDDPMPVIFMRTPYNQDGLSGSALKWLEKGYIAVTQDFRGQFYSEGSFRAFMSCATDGYDTIEWIYNQPWCNGKIATVGMSAGAVNQYFSAGENPPGLVAQHLDMGCGEIYDLVGFTGGQLRLSQIKAWINATAYSSLYFNDKDTDSSLNMYYEFLNHTLKDSYWNNVSLSQTNKYENVSVRALHFGGWYDVFSQGTLNGYMGYVNSNNVYANGHQKLVIGPYTHGSRSGPCGEIVFPNAKYGVEVAERWRDEIFAESIPAAGIYPSKLNEDLWKEGNVLFYMMGDVLNESSTGNRWILADTWPVNYSSTNFYFEDDGSLRTNKATSNHNFSYIYDPTDPVSTLGGNDLVQPAGVYNQADLIDSRSDIITFETPILTKPTEIAGPVRVKLFVSSNCTDTDFTAKLTDIYPNGYNAIITDGLLNVRKRNGYNVDELITPGEVYEIEIDLWSTAYQFNNGHKIQVSISSSNYPKWNICPNTGAPYADSYDVTYDANNTILISSAYDSCIELPIYDDL